MDDRVYRFCVRKGKGNWDYIDYYPNWVTGKFDEGTLCQFIGQQDVLGRDIYEGDIVCGPEFDVENEDGGYGIVEWDNHTARYVIRGLCQNDLCVDFDSVYGKEFEIIGNKWDNPEYLESDK